MPPLPRRPPDILVCDWNGRDALPVKPTEYPGAFPSPDDAPKLKERGMNACLGDLASWSTYWFSRGIRRLDLECVAEPGRTAPSRPLPGFFEEHFACISAIYARLADEESRETYLGCIKAREMGDPLYIKPTPYTTYFHPQVPFHPGDIACDGGAFDGETTRQMLNRVGPPGKVYGFGLVPSRYEKAKMKFARHTNMLMENCGLWSNKSTGVRPRPRRRRRVTFNAAPNAVPVPLISLDDYFATSRERCDAIKLDVEGAELSCLQGAWRLLKTCRPKLQISVYHNVTDYFTIPLFLLSANLGYKFYYGHTAFYGFHDSVLYAMPA